MRTNRGHKPRASRQSRDGHNGSCPGHLSEPQGQADTGRDGNSTLLLFPAKFTGNTEVADAADRPDLADPAIGSVLGNQRE